MQQAEANNQSGEQFNDSGAKSNEESSEDEQQKQEKFYVPLAFVICTEIENHDIFRAIL